jgi:hypothetical protein
MPLTTLHTQHARRFEQNHDIGGDQREAIME